MTFQPVWQGHVPLKFRRTVFNSLHSLSHPGIRASQRLLTSRFVLPYINQYVKKWTRTCLACQKAKIHHVSFHHTHIDIVDPLPQSEGCAYMLNRVLSMYKLAYQADTRELCADTRKFRLIRANNVYIFLLSNKIGRKP